MANTSILRVPQPSRFCLGGDFVFRIPLPVGDENIHVELEPGARYFRTWSMVNFRSPARNMETALSDPNWGTRSRCLRPCCSMRNRTTETGLAAGIG
jgi:hypothetical protein